MTPISYARAAITMLRRTPADISARVVEAIEACVADPASQPGSVKALTGREGIRLRVGDWCVVMADGIVLAVMRGGLFDERDGDDHARRI